jgi:uncharacterized RmlC-like cupin family protein
MEPVMEANHISPEVMEQQQIARLRNLKPTKYDYLNHAPAGVPVEAYEMVASKNIYLLMAPKERTRSFSKPAVLGAPGLEVSIVDCPPGNGPPLHVHERTRETFLVLTGSYEVTWGDHGEHRTVLEAFDMFAVPPGIYRSFRNISSSDAKLLVIVQGEAGQVMNDIYYQESLGQQVSARFGDEIWEKMRSLGLRIASGDTHEAVASAAQSANATYHAQAGVPPAGD